jgi:hypothetical protein
MSEAHTIQPQSDADLPPLRLSGAAFASWDDRYEYDVESLPSAIEPIEHQLRIDAVVAGYNGDVPEARSLLDSHGPYSDEDSWRDEGKARPFVLRRMEQTCEEQWEREQAIFEQIEREGESWTAPDDAPEYLAHRIEQALRTGAPPVELGEIRENRENWYLRLIPMMNLNSLFTQSSLGSLLGSRTESNRYGHNTHVGVVVVENTTHPQTYADEHDLPHERVLQVREAIEKQGDDPVHPSDFGIELPAPLLVGEYQNGSQYLWLPWSDGLVCSCPYKHSEAFRVMCKHELVTALKIGALEETILPLDKGFNVPARCRRFISPDEMSNQHHTL